MIPEMSSKQLTRLTPESINAIFDYRRKMKKIDGKTPSINSAINALIGIGWEQARKLKYTRRSTSADEVTK